ncbi:MAG: hypothetical protein OEM02_16070 [Desulfobulbaceae bacterium]|nr:hypothetical protein [Desulfobulbaceae bacterium]
MKPMYMFEDVFVPVEFLFPKAYLEFMQSGFPDLTPWWFVAEEPAKAKMFYQTINKCKRSKKLLIPFAKIDDSTGDIACFDGEDTTGNPKIFFSVGSEDSMSCVDWKKRYFLEDINAWLIIAQKDAKRWREN